MGQDVQPHYDLIVVGCTAAGAAAAIRARQLGLRAAVVESGSPAQTSALCWFHRQAGALAEACGLDLPILGGVPFRGLTLHSPDFRKRIDVQHADLAGWLVRSDDVAKALIALASDAGADRIPGVVRDVALAEDRASVTLRDGSVCQAAVMLIDDGPKSATAQMIRLPCAGDAVATRCVSVTVEGGGKGGRIDVVLAAGRGNALGFVARTDRVVQAGLLGAEPSDPNPLRAFLAGAHAAGLFPTSDTSMASVCPRPAGVALDMEAHVGKRALLIGCAGGFVAAFNCDILYPAMRSGWLAAETAARALAAPVLQDELASFDMAWRTDLAEYLRRPNTDLSLLLPLVFNENLQMSQRVARAFLLGEKF